ncbi:MAG TPA: Phenylacetic acid catabolic protein [Chloroflexota bacterium]|nr:Phenylacetic acid catabolic protein [Chloroflexota bacterium]
MTEAVDSPALEILIATLADNKYFLGRRYAEWCTGAPSLEAAVAAAGMAQDEIGHARSFYPLLRDVAGEEVEPETRTDFVNAPFLDRPFAGWVDFTVANFLFDTAIAVLLEAARGSSFRPLAHRAARILEEEQLHWLHGEGWLLRLCAGDGAMRRAVHDAVALVRPQALDFFEIAAPELVEQGVLALSSDELADAFEQRVGPVLAEAGIAG